MTAQNQDTESLFKKKMNIAIIVLIFASVSMVLIGIAHAIYGIVPSISGFTSAYVPTIIYAACLLIFAIIGKIKGKENRIMSFIFGIGTLVLNAILIIDRIPRTIINIVHASDSASDLPLYPDPRLLADTILYFAAAALLILIIIFSIWSIVNSIFIIKENVPSSGSTTIRPASSGFVTQPAIASTPPPAASSIQKSKFCASCGAPLDAGAAFCNKCGAKA